MYGPIFRDDSAVIAFATGSLQYSAAIEFSSLMLKRARKPLFILYSPHGMNYAKEFQINSPGVADVLPGAGRDKDGLAGANLSLFGVDVHLALSLQNEVHFRGGFKPVRKGRFARLKSGMSDAVREVRPIASRMKKLAETCVIGCFEILAFCQIFYEHLPT